MSIVKITFPHQGEVEYKPCKNQGFVHWPHVTSTEPGKLVLCPGEGGYDVLIRRSLGSEISFLIETFDKYTQELEERKARDCGWEIEDYSDKKMHCGFFSGVYDPCSNLEQHYPHRTGSVDCYGFCPGRGGNRLEVFISMWDSITWHQPNKCLVVVVDLGLGEDVPLGKFKALWARILGKQEGGKRWLGYGNTKNFMYSTFQRGFRMLKRWLWN